MVTIASSDVQPSPPESVHVRIYPKAFCCNMTSCSVLTPTRMKRLTIDNSILCLLYNPIQFPLYSIQIETSNRSSQDDLDENQVESSDDDRDDDNISVYEV